MTVHIPNGAPVSMILLITILFTGCATKNAPRIFHSDNVPHKAHQLAEVKALLSRAQILSRPWVYKTVSSAGVADQDIQDGSVGMGSVYCCGGEGTAEVQLPAIFIFRQSTT